jgi:outer membrane immunogenic protein
MKRVIFGGLAISALLIAAPLGTASAADLPVKGPSYAPAPMPVATWTGCYIGGNLGEAWVKKNVTETEFFGDSDNFDLSSASGSGWAYGGQIGCDYQINSNWVFGVRGMWDGTNVKGNTTGPSDGETQAFSFNAQSFATAVARVGYLLTPQLMLYALGGVATTHDKYSVLLASPPNGGTTSASSTGYDVGAGVSWMLNPNWDFFVEYDYMGFGTSNVAFLTQGAEPNLSVTDRVSETEQKILAGLDWRFTNLGR